MLIKKTENGYVDAETGKDVSDLIRAYETSKVRACAGSKSTPVKARATRATGKLWRPAS